MSLILKSRLCGNVCVLECEGRIMAGHDCMVLEAALDHAAHESACIVLNLSQVNRVDSSGLGLLMRHTCRLNKRGGAIRLACPQPFVTHLLGITHLSDTLRSYPTEQEAVQSFLAAQTAQSTAAKCGATLLVFDPSADLCVFMRSVLASHGFDVRTVCSLRDAKLLLRVDAVDYILIGPGTPQLLPEFTAQELSAISPKASVLHFGSNLDPHNPANVTASVLQMLGVGGA